MAAKGIVISDELILRPLGQGRRNHLPFLSRLPQNFIDLRKFLPQRKRRFSHSTGAIFAQVLRLSVAHKGRRHRAIVRALRCNASAIRLRRHGWPDCRREPDRGGAPTQHRGREEGDIPDNWKDKPAKLRPKDRDARWTVSSLRPSQDGSTPPVDLAIPVRSTRLRLHSQMGRDGCRRL